MTEPNDQLDADELAERGLALIDWLRQEEGFGNRELLGMITWALLQLLDQMNEPENTARTANFLSKCFRSMFLEYNQLLVQGSDTFH
jgi:hypothetical protein